MLSRLQAEKIMNEYGKANEPFLFIIDFEMEHSLVCKLSEVDSSELLYWMNGTTNLDDSFTHLIQNIEIKKKPVSFDDYFNGFQKVQQEISFGNTYLLNLTFCTPITLNVSLKDVFIRSKARYKLWYKDEFTVFSPEIFVKIIDGKIFSFPMKGTIDASLENSQAKILEDEKEIAEHFTIVDLIRNDLSMVAQRVHVTKFRYIEKIKTHEKELLQVSSEICGELYENYQNRLGTIIFQLLPAGSICGAPKKKTVEIIKDSESYKRGFYTGIAGIFDGKNLDSGVLIRFIEKTPDGYLFKSGGGITSFSNPESEYQEMIDKVYVATY